MTVEECFKRTEQVQKTLNTISNDLSLQNQTLNGPHGVERQLEKLNKTVYELQKAYKNNGHMSGASKAMIITGAIGGVTGIVTTFITALSAAK